VVRTDRGDGRAAGPTVRRRVGVRVGVGGRVGGGVGGRRDYEGPRRQQAGRLRPHAVAQDRAVGLLDARTLAQETVAARPRRQLDRRRGRRGAFADGTGVHRGGVVAVAGRPRRRQ